MIPFKLICRVFLAAFILLFTVWPQAASAIVDPTGTFKIEAVDVYEHLLETNDQLYVIQYTLVYATAPLEMINQAYLFRLVNTATLASYGQIQPISYYNKGYASAADQQWLASIYIPAASAPTWGSSAYTMRFEGNPALTWVPPAPIPLATMGASGFTWHTSADNATTRGLLASRLRTLMYEVENDWPIFDMIQGFFISSSKLTATGVDYLTSVMPYLYLFCPEIFPTGLSPPSQFSVREKSFTKTRSSQLEGKSLGPTIDNFFAHQYFGLSPLLFKSIFGFVIIGIVAAVISVKSGTPKPALFAVIPLGLGLAYISVGTIIFWGIVAMFAVIAFVFIFFLKRAA